MRTEADHHARVRDPASELLLGHAATFTDGRCGRRRGAELIAVPGTTHYVQTQQPDAVIDAIHKVTGGV